MFRIILLLFYMGLIHAEIQTRKFRVKPDSNIVGNQTVIGHARSAIQCTSQCLQSTTCCASSFNRKNMTCVTEHADGFGISKEEAIDSVTMVTGIRKYNEYLVRDCSELSICHGSGIYTINPASNVTFEVYCDMVTDGGGWTVFQRRTDGTTDFYRGWTEYEEGFGNLTNEFWLGNQNINQLTSSGWFKLRVDLADFNDSTRYALYSSFSVGNMESNYTLSISGYSGDAGNSFSDPTQDNKHLNGMKFSTFDRDNDKLNGNCAILFKGAWWYNHCHRSNLNGQYLEGPHESKADGVNWFHWRGYYYSLKSTTMMVKRQK